MICWWVLRVDLSVDKAFEVNKLPGDDAKLFAQLPCQSGFGRFAAFHLSVNDIPTARIRFSNRRAQAQKNLCFINNQGACIVR